MLPLQKILCPTDFSDTSQYALDVASRLAQDFGAELCVLNVVEPSEMELRGEAYGAAQINRENRAAAQKRVEEFVAEHVPATVRARGLARLGDMSEQIEATIEEENAELLVIATRGLQGWRHLVFGSVTERTVRLASCPVLALHGGGEHPITWPPRKILCPTDFSEPSDEALSKAGELAEHYGAALAVMNAVWTLSEPDAPGEEVPLSYDRLKISEAQAKLNLLVARQRPATAHTYPVLRLGQPADAIESAAEDEGADLIVLATHGASGWQRFFYGSVAEQVLRKTTFPLLIVHGPAPAKDAPKYTPAKSMDF